MVGINLQQELNSYIHSMQLQGILDHNFDRMRQMKDDDSPLCISQVIRVIMTDADSALTEFHLSLLEPSTDYNKLMTAAHQLREACSSVGGHRVALACRELRNASDAQDKNRCAAIFQRLVADYKILHVHFDHIMDLENQIMLASERRQRRRRN